MNGLNLLEVSPKIIGRIFPLVLAMLQSEQYAGIICRVRRRIIIHHLSVDKHIESL